MSIGLEKLEDEFTLRTALPATKQYMASRVRCEFVGVGESRNAWSAVLVFAEVASRAIRYVVLTPLDALIIDVWVIVQKARPIIDEVVARRLVKMRSTARMIDSALV